MKLILASHGNLAKGINQTLTMIIDEQPQITPFSAYNEDNIDFVSEIKKIIDDAKQTQEQVVIVTDVFGGSVNNEATRLLLTYPDIFVIAGMNLPLVMNLAMHEGKIDDQQIKEIVQESKNSLIYVNEQLKAVQEEDEL